MHSASSLRFNGFINAMDEHSLERNFDWIIQGDFSFESGFKAGEKIFHQLSNLLLFLQAMTQWQLE